MKITNSTLWTALLTLLSLTNEVRAARKPSNAVLLSNVQTLTLRKGAKTSSRRVSPIPQLTCIGGNAKPHYEIDVLRCTNSGTDYDDTNVQWTCKASLPPEFKLGSTDVICEGYENADDPYVLKGSCGVEYRLILTDMGEQKYGKGRSSWFGGGSDDSKSDGEEAGGTVSTLFWLVFIGVLLWMIYNVFKNNTRRAGNAGGRAQPRRPGGGFWGGGGGGDDDPPPPYDPRPPQPPRKQYPSSSTQTGNSGPGFWSGALGGAAAGYAARSMMGNNNTRQQAPAYGQAGGSNWFSGGGSSSRTEAGSFSSGPSPSSSRYESTGFGESRRR